VRFPPISALVLLRSLYNNNARLPDREGKCLAQQEKKRAHSPGIAWGEMTAKALVWLKLVGLRREVAPLPGVDFVTGLPVWHYLKKKACALRHDPKSLLNMQKGWNLSSST